MKNKQTEDFPESFYVMIEIPMGSNCKYEYKEELDNIVLDRVLFTAMTYPANYGFALDTRGKDGDPLDVLVFSSVSINPGIIVRCRAIGVAEMNDEEGEDNKILAVPVDKVDPASSIVRNESDIPEYQKDKLKHFFEHYKELEKGKFMKFHGFKGRDEAVKQLAEARLKQ
ncbi:inorganic pyrophosphatase [Thermoplasma volcanium GSS1]|uniref:Inorganic pyrophosphatase n=1 Tax=Thermoplasma volcanium (strain ATCC 51530 / DSM 4299 / JCM 9571 / NBRC 15438 / GSS1) TaxID=273116 RepID=IPYR_THEVO|nr:inorganic diphosphatase [Thermoplasma volcanium]Q979E6.1 RecName: Full=Inorganic pyrophosphatase; AltName: Full=Pyrophosphate phospho-hydrolase; Short=PPase [Thermoplasma volcanium GSS1]BAB60357.1 inorganic pyrophosphatase [Thermoplasma volcanium GSS1]